MVHFSQIPIVEALVNKNHSLALHLQPINGSIIAAKPKVADAGAGAPRCPGRRASPLPCAGVHATGRGTAGNQAPLLQTRPDSSDESRFELS